MKIKIGIAFIHNNESDRIKDFNETIKLLSLKLTKAGLQVNLCPSTFQPPLKNIKINYFKEVFKRLHYVYKWIYYRNENSLTSLIYYVMYVIKTIYKNFNLNYIQKKRVLFKFEKILFFKHIYSFIWSVNNEVDFLIVLESDAFLIDNKSTAERLTKLIKIVKKHKKNSLLFGIFAHSCDMQTLNIEKLIDSAQTDITYYNKPVTNGAMGYILNAKLIRKIINSKDLIKNTFLPIDAFLNLFFIKNFFRLKKTDIGDIFFILDPPIFISKKNMSSSLEKFRI